MKKKKKTKKTQKRFSRSLSIFDPAVTKHIDALQMALVRAGRDTILPELYEIFGKADLLKFLDIFAGTTVEVPPKAVVENAIRDTYVYLSLEEAVDSGNKKRVQDVVGYLADRYSISRKALWNIHREMRKLA